MPELPPRPAPDGVTIILQRRPKSGFVNYPLFFQKRMVDGRARFMTKCDMLIGPCACGYTHFETEDWVQDLLEMYNCKVEPLILWGGELASRGLVVEIPGYWKQIRNWEYSSCDVLVGKCVCERTHRADTSRTRKLLKRHHSVILNMPPQEAKAKPKKSKLKTEVDARYGGFTPVVISEEQGVSGSNPLTDTEVNDYLRDEHGNPIEPPTSIRREVDNVVSGCDCTSCRRLQMDTHRRLVREWIEASIDMNNSSVGGNASRAWAADNCNEVGQVPGWCNCSACTVVRIDLRDRNRNRDRDRNRNRPQPSRTSSYQASLSRQAEDRMHRRPATGDQYTPEDYQRVGGFFNDASTEE